MDYIIEDNIDQLQELIPAPLARKAGCVVLSAAGTSLLIGISAEQSDPSQQVALKEELAFLTGKQIAFQSIDPSLLASLLIKHYPIQQGSDQRVTNNYYSGRPEHFLTDLISEAKKLKSSDIHIEAFEQFCRVRIRMDGLLVLRYLIEKDKYPSLINKIKITAGLDIAEKRLPQDGRIFFKQDDTKFDIRVSILPTLFGEKVVLRLLNNDATDIELSTLGFSDSDYKNYTDGIRKPNGILLISGPTGSGKTTTLYATLKMLNEPTRNIVTIEDPIEYTLEGVNQVQVKESIGLTFASGLKTFLRQDPDIIMLGEIRDGETANMAIRAALTGHLVLSTIHTNSAWGTVSRLLDLDLPGFLVAGTLNTSIAQRLVRLLCPVCKKEVDFDPSLYPGKYKAPKVLNKHYISQGCPACFQTGYKGRKAIYEVIPIDEDIAEEIRKGTARIDALLQQKGIRTLSQNAFELFSSGATSLSEVFPLLTNY